MNDYLSKENYGSMGAITDYWNHVICRDGLISWPRTHDKKIKKTYEFIHHKEFNRQGTYGINTQSIP